MKMLTCLALLLASCETPPASFDDFWSRNFSLACDADVRCCDVDDTTASCLQNLNSQFGFDHDAVNAAIADGSMTYDSAAAQRCLDSSREAFASCTNDVHRALATERDCLHVLNGTISEGQHCPLFGGCAAGLVCIQSFCVVPPAAMPAGAACTAPDYCQSGACLYPSDENGGVCAASGNVTNAWLCVDVPI